MLLLLLFFSSSDYRITGSLVMKPLNLYLFSNPFQISPDNLHPVYNEYVIINPGYLSPGPGDYRYPGDMCTQNLIAATCICQRRMSAVVFPAASSGTDRA
jgi:hypothetical protein